MDEDLEAIGDNLGAVRGHLRCILVALVLSLIVAALQTVVSYVVRVVATFLGRPSPPQRGSFLLPECHHKQHDEDEDNSNPGDDQ
jgi:hypothetical protein